MSLQCGTGMQGFKAFLSRGNAVDLAVGVIIGASFKSIVDALVEDVINPLLGVMGGQPDFGALNVTIENNIFKIGHLCNTIISFLIMAMVLYFGIITPYNWLLKKLRRKAPATQDCPFCASSIPVQATVCSFCTRDVGTLAPIIPAPVTY
ncbi:large conductance mechanosensitive channel protein [Gregarina niphandrodes]|uniref:Large conductance mechanosensitive channel protein n=1 Tax=Gregarina niphandrodes TaxID=110365 RepID=A0A023BB83_GRENI|nr:large conductance mechanosensitive channel protein [Gregarina niphandrodes]EZG79306.1 large conductance mechanosensitive channel protein [Gregarina niphandrodes]|eukprot:XP_011129075.1 large conductance mechanosensitive channel protein [Gregarina niphandrodes]